jgi:hypothetical protein
VSDINRPADNNNNMMPAPSQLKINAGNHYNMRNNTILSTESDKINWSDGHRIIELGVLVTSLG